MKHIVHIVYRDKFTQSYINFMEKYMTQFSHEYYVSKGDKYPLAKLPNLHEVNFCDAYSNPENKKMFKQCDKIIISGCFNLPSYLRFNYKYLNKTYMQFWGADFYGYRDRLPLFPFKNWIYRQMSLYCIRHCRAIISLIKTDYDALSEICKVKKRYFVAPMPSDPNNVIDYKQYTGRNRTADMSIRIIVGNSATETNHHLEVFKVLEHFKNENIEVITPLSYGNCEYRDIIIKQGYNIFGDKYIPILDYMKITEYIEFLNSVDIGMFNNDRQQALGNIFNMLVLKKKIFLRDGTATKKHCTSNGIKTYSITSVNEMSFEEFISTDEEELQNNKEQLKKLVSIEKKIEQWNMVLTDKTNKK